MRHYVVLMRPVNGIMASVAAIIGYLVAGAQFSTVAFLAAAVVFLVSAGGMAINDYYDAEIDKLNKPNRPIPSGKVKKEHASWFAYALFAMGIIVSYFINIPALLVAIVAAAVLVLYAARLKKTLLLGHVAISFLVGLSFVFGGVAAGNYQPALLMAFLAFLSNTAREIYKSIEDVLGDGKHSVNSIAVKHGVFKAKMIANAFLIVAVVFSFVPYALGFSQTYLFFVVLADIAFISAIIAPAKHSAKLCKIGMFIALLAFLAAAIKL